MGRVVIIVGLAAISLMASITVASSSEEVRLPIPTSDPVNESDESSVTVARGDHLWKISARRLAEIDPGRRIAPYWLEVIDLNLPTLRSGDPDLIYPGEIVVLPALSEQP